jgi:hypothetical protein
LTKIVGFACDLVQKMKEKLVLIYVSKESRVAEEYIEIGGRYQGHQLTGHP